MLQVSVPQGEVFDEKTSEFISVAPIVLRLEHSLVSISKWEAKWKQPFLSSNEKTTQQMLDYVACMTLNQNVDENVYRVLPQSLMTEISNYIAEDQTATWFTEKRVPPSREVVTSELIYYWMTAHNIPFECQKWHLSRLLTLIRICNIKNNPEQKKMSKSDIYARNRKLNAARRKARNSRG